MNVCLRVAFLFWLVLCVEAKGTDGTLSIRRWQATELFSLADEPIRLTCDTIGDPVEIRWLRDGQLIGYGNLLNVQASEHSNDPGNYRCLATDRLGTIVSTSLRVRSLAIDTLLTTLPRKKGVHLGSPFVLDAPKLTKNVDVTWNWFFNNLKVNIGNDLYITSTGTLVVLDSTGYFGSYKLVATVEGVDYSSPDIIVAENIFNSDAQIPSVLYGPQNTTVVVDDEPSVFFDCVPSDREKRVHWSLNGVSLNDGPDTRISHGDRRLELSYSQISAKDQNVVSCSVVMDAGTVMQSDALVKIQRKAKIDRRNLISTLHKAVGSTVIIHCEVTGLPSPNINWYFNGKIVDTNTSDYTIDHLSIYNYGYYQCEAFNSVGSDIEKISILNAGDKKEGIQSAPKIIDPPRDVTAKVGTEVVFKCGFVGQPKSVISWKHNGSLLSSNDVFAIDGSVLSISAVSQTTAGEYTCVVINELGRDVKSAILEITGSGLIEYGPSDQNILIGSNVVMPCKKSKEFEGSNGLMTVWKWNNHEIPILGDAVHRLSITPDGSLSIKQVGPDNIGLYSCTVKLGDQEQTISAVLKIIEKPSMPQSVVAEVLKDVTPTRIRISWKQGFDGNSPLIKHVIEMRSIGPTGLWSDWETVVDNIPTELCCTSLIDNLKPSSTLEFRIVAVNRHGSGKPSLPSNNITMPQQPPAAAPRNVAASARSWSSVMVQWQPPPPEQWNGDILGYIIRYRLANYASLPWLEKNISNGHARNAPLEHLITWREYEIQVAAFNDRGMGVFSKTLYVTTLEGVPTQAPYNVTVTVLNSTAISVSFVPPDQQMIPGVNQGYKIELWKDGITPMALYRQVLVLPNEQTENVVINDLEKFGHYNVTVLCFTSPGEGPRSEPVEAVTMEDLPGSVDNLHFETVDFNSVIVAWDRPIESNGIIVKYDLQYWEDDLPSNSRALEISSSKQNITIEQLNASTHYTVTIRAFTAIGGGPSTEAKFKSGVPPELPDRPASLVVSDVGPRTITLQFVPGFDGHTQIRKWIVEAKIASSQNFVEIFSINAPKLRSFVVDSLRPFTKYQLRLIAENIKGQSPPSDPSREFETKQAEPESPPDHLSAEPTSSRSITVFWLPLKSTHWNGDPRGYLIMFAASSSSNGQWNEVRTSNIRVGEFQLSGLQPYTTYEIKIMAENSVGRSVQSNSVLATTYEDVPSGAPNSVKAFVDDRRRVVVTWEPVSDSEANGVVVAYKVELISEDKSQYDESNRSVIMPYPDVLKTAFSQLSAFNTYIAFVSAHTIVGEGPRSESVTVQMPEDVPSEPSNVAFSYVSDNEVRLKWISPHHPNGRIHHYEVSYWREDDKSDATKIQLPHNVYGFSATGLDSETRYQFGVAAETNVGWGPQAVLTVTTTTKRLPPPIPSTPRLNNARAQSSRELSVIWDEPHVTEDKQFISPVRSTSLEYQILDGNWMSLSFLIAAPRHEAVIDRLRPNTAYRVRIRFHTDFDQSGWSVESSWLKTLTDAPSAPPQSIQATPYESTSVLLQWNAPEKNQWNSDFVRYRILYDTHPSNNSFEVEEVYEKRDEDSEIKFMLRKLISFRHYVIKIQTVNEYGSSEPSPPVFVYVGYAIPKRKITNVHAEAISSTAAAVYWDPWLSDPDDAISGFKVRSIMMNTTSETKNNAEEITMTENSSVVLNDLKKFTEYQIFVSAYNRAGEGELAETRILTLEDRPGPVTNLKFTDILLDSVNVSWDAPIDCNGRIQAYIINYRTYKLKEEFKKEIQEKTLLTYIVASNLEENVTYFFSVQAETAAGYGIEVIGNVTTGPNPGSPESPSKPHVTPGQSSVRLEWHNGHAGITPIKGHIIQAKRIAHANNQKIASDDTRYNRLKRDNSSKRNRHVLGEWRTISTVYGIRPQFEVGYEELEPASLYVFRLFAFNSIGVGNASPESNQLFVPAMLPDEPFYTKWWFIVMVAMASCIVIVIVIAFLCVTGSRYNYEKRNSVDSLQLADGGIASYELKASKRKNFHTRMEMPVRPNTNTSWISDIREPPTYGSIVGIDSAQLSCTNMYGALTTDRVVTDTGNASLLNMGFAKRLPSNERINQESMYDDFSVDEESALDESEHETPADGFGIVPHDEHEDIYRNTWRRARAKALAETTSKQNTSRFESGEKASTSEIATNSYQHRATPNQALGFSSFV